MKNINEILNELQVSQLDRINIHPEIQTIQLNFVLGSQGKVIIIELLKIAHLVISRLPEDYEGCYNVFTVKLDKITDELENKLNELCYLFKKGDTETEISFLKKNLLHFHLEGDISIEVICENISILDTIYNFGVE